ncbi:MAG: AAA family ATPase [Saprospiraceae bacterium]|nr:AAA family ATPase [Saprospiraceae bacterium]
MEKPEYNQLTPLPSGTKYIIVRTRRTSNGEYVVMKRLKTPYPTAQELSRLQSEFSLLQKIHHPHIARALALEPYENSQALILEDQPGIPLSEYLQKGPLDLGLFFELALQMTDALQSLHHERIVYKSLAPGNILFDPKEGILKLYGFNLAVEMGREAQQPSASEAFEAGLTYVSPEQTGRMNRSLDHRTDLYSLGAVFYTMLTGQPPFVTDDPMEMVHCHIARQPVDINLLRPDLPVVLSNIVHHLLAKSVEERYQSAAGVRFDLFKCLKQYTSDGHIKAFKLGEKDVSDQFHIPDTLYGRDAELANLKDAFRRTENGRAEVVLISGYSGVGKSRLVAEIQKNIGQTRGFFISGKFDQFKRDVPLSSLLVAFGELIRQLLMESDERIQSWRQKTLQAVGVNAQVIIDVVPELALLTGPQPAVPELPALEASNRFQETFNRFVRVFAQAEHPMCIFLDDLQWIDSATRQWIETQLTDQNLSHFLLIGAYRNNEAPAGHPLLLMIDRLVQQGVHVQDIRIKPLDLSTLNHLVADTLLQSPKQCAALTNLLYQKTDGNPFFVRQCLLSLYESEAVYFGPELQVWTYNLDKVRQAKISDNVVELMVGLIQKLSSDVQNLLKIAACIGNRFELDTLSLVSGSDHDTTARYIDEAARQGLLVALHTWHDTGEETYVFLHDRVQQAALSLLDASEKQKVRLQIGHLLLTDVQDIESDERIYDIADHLNFAGDLLTDPTEKNQLANINHRASQRAKNATAYEPALSYIKHAMALVPSESWENPSVFTRTVLTQRAECEHLCGNDTAAETFFNQAIDHANTVLDKAAVYQRKLHFYTNLRQFAKAYQTGREAVGLLGVKLPATFVPPLLIKEIILFRALLGRKKASDITKLSEMSDPERQMAILLMATFARSAYQIKPELCIHVCAKMSNICLRHGNTDGGFIGFMAVGPIFFGAILGQKQTGFDFGELTVNLVEKYRSQMYKSEVHFVVGYFAIPWRKPATEMERYWQIAYESGLESGDFFHAGCAACGTVQSLFMRGAGYDEILNTSDRYLDFLQRTNNKEAILTLSAVRQSIKNLRGQTESPLCYNDAEFNEAAYMDELAGFGSRHFAHYYYINKMQTLYLWGAYEEAYRVAKQSDRFLTDSPGMLHTAEHFFYKALIICALYPASKGKQRFMWRLWLKKTDKQFQKYADGCADNFIHKSRLLSAEIERAFGNTQAAQNFLYEAIDLASEYGYLNIQALANLRAWHLHHTEGRQRIAQVHLRDAENAYDALGAQGLTHRLLSFYGIEKAAWFGSETRNDNGNLDLTTVLKSSEAISREIRLRDLLSQLMRITLENAGAQRMLMVLARDNNLVVAAERLAGENEDHQLPETPLEQFGPVAKTVVRYVAHAHEPVVLDNAAASGAYTHDAYIQEHKIRSLMCAPLMQQGKLTGVVYLENNLTNGAFTKERIALLHLLSGQMATSIENAFLYNNLEKKVKDRTLQLNEEKDKADALLLNILPAETAEELKKTGTSKARDFDQATVLFTDFRNFSQACEKLSAQELVEEIHYYYSAFDNIIASHGVEKIKTIGDSYMCAGGLLASRQSNPADTVHAALAIRDFMLHEKKEREKSGKPVFEIRIGLHTGPVVAGIVGIKKFAYDIWGDSVNIASRMESSGEPGKVNISGDTYELVKDVFECTYRGKIEAKNKGMIDMYFVEGPKKTTSKTRRKIDALTEKAS